MTVWKAEGILIVVDKRRFNGMLITTVMDSWKKTIGVHATTTAKYSIMIREVSHGLLLTVQFTMSDIFNIVYLRYTIVRPVEQLSIFL